ncbi:MAG: hypothetical protein Q4G46_15015 [Propionibacteriaceae bacterium]|nr:hypothetical protein [Propionibacteriaceae bacterium]
MVMVGAAPEELERLAAAMGQAADRIDGGVRVRIGSQLRSSPWRGRDADHFRSDWSSSLNPQLLRTAQWLRDADTQLKQQAREQREASQAGGDAAHIQDIGFLLGSLQGSSQSSIDWEGLSEIFNLGGSTLKIPDLLHSVSGLNVGDVSGRSLFLDAEGILNNGAVTGLFSDVLGGISVAGDVVGFFGSVAELIDDPSGSSVSGLLAGMSDLVSSGADLLGNSAVAGIAGRASSGFSAISDFASAAEKFSDDPLGATFDIVHGTANAVGIAVPPVGWCVSAWDFGWGVGEAIAKSGPAQGVLDTAVDIGAARAAAEGSEIATRYEGLGGVVNYFSDSGAAIGQKISGLFGGPGKN